MIFVFTGNGKGKTTAAIGHGIRVVGQGKKVLLIQFIKNKKWPTGEEMALREFAGRFEIITGGKGFVGILGDRLPRSVHKKAAQDTLKKASKLIFSKKFDLVILDEINVALSLKLITIKDVLSILRLIPNNLDVILTGRGAPKELIRIADLVTEFREIKHYYGKGAIAKKGREY